MKNAHGTTQYESETQQCILTRSIQCPTFTMADNCALYK